jgi:flagellar assembly factor FliW
MKVQTTRFGQIEVDEERLIFFSKGLLGFPENCCFALLQINDEGNFFWLQSVERPELAFVVCDPVLFVPDYKIPAKLEDFHQINLTNMSNAQVMVIVNKVERTLTGNLQGPIVINAINRQGRQLVLSEKKYSTRHPLMDLTDSARKQQVSKTA